MLTEETITDDQIRALQAEYNPGSVSHDLCRLALTPDSTMRFERLIDTKEARRRIAWILNNRRTT